MHMHMCKCEIARYSFDSFSMFSFLFKACSYFTSFTCPLRLVFHALDAGTEPFMVMFKVKKISPILIMVFYSYLFD